MNNRERQALDRHITGNYGEDQFKDERQADARGPLERLTLKTHCEMCGDHDKGSRHRAHLEPGFNPSGKPMTLCRDCRIGSAELLQEARELVVTVEGGLVQDVFRIDRENQPHFVGYTVLDWDQFKQDPDGDIAERWSGYPFKVREYIEKALPDEFQQFQDAIKRASEEEKAKP